MHAALDRAGADDGLMIGDTTWDCEAAERPGVATVAVLTGGFSEAELLEAGAVAVFESLRRAAGGPRSAARGGLRWEPRESAAAG